MKPLRHFLAATIVFAGFAAGGRAFAFFRTPAVGSAAVLLHNTFTVSVVGSAPGQRLRPGSISMVAAVVTNTNGVDVVLNSVTVGTVTTDHPGCPGTALIARPEDPLDLTPLTGGATRELPVALELRVDAPSQCQGAQFSIPLTVKVKR